MKLNVVYPDGRHQRGDWTRPKRLPEVGEEIVTPEGLFFGTRYAVTQVDAEKREITLREVPDDAPQPLRWITFRFPDGRWRTQRWNKPTPVPGDEFEGYRVARFVEPARVELENRGG